MSTAEEQAIRTRLHAELDGVLASPPPACAVLREGRRVRWQRRGAAVAAVAVIVALAATLPQAVHARKPPPAAGGLRHPRVSVYPPQHGAPPGEVAQGRVSGRRWRIVLSGPAGRVTVTGPAANESGSPGPSLSPGEPGTFMTWGGSPGEAVVGQVALDVTRVTARLRGGTVLTMHPVTYQGARFVAFGLPAGLAVTYITAYGSNGEIARTVPYNYFGSDVTDPGPQFFGLWNRPGQPVQARLDRRFSAASGRGLGIDTVRVSAGPWGICWRDSKSTGPQCVATTLASLLPGRTVLNWMGCATVGGDTTVVGIAQPEVRSVRLRLPAGRWLRMPAVTAGSFRFYAGIVTGFSGQLGAWRAYDAAGQLVGSGKQLSC